MRGNLASIRGITDRSRAIAPELAAICRTRGSP